MNLIVSMVTGTYLLMLNLIYKIANVLYKNYLFLKAIIIPIINKHEQMKKIDIKDRNKSFKWSDSETYTFTKMCKNENKM